MQMGMKGGGVIIAGTATRDAEFKEIGDKKTPVAELSLAVNARGEESKYVNIKAFGDALANYAKHIKKGDSVAAAGYIETRTYQEKTYNDLNCQWLNFVGKTANRQADPQQGTPDDEYEDLYTPDGELPF